MEEVLAGGDVDGHDEAALLAVTEALAECRLGARPDAARALAERRVLVPRPEPHQFVDSRTVPGAR